MDVAAHPGASARERVVCDHCGLPVPEGLIEEGAERQFCCHGCSSVYAILHGAGLEGYYGVREAVDARPQRPESRGVSYEEFDDDAFAAAYTHDEADGTRTCELLVEGVHCAACVWLLERLPRVEGGVLESRANIRSRTVRVRYEPERTALSSIARAIDALGYRPHPARGTEAREMRVREDRAFLIRVGVAGALAGNIMLLAIALYGGAFSGISETWSTTFRWYSMGLGVLTLAWPGRVFFKGAIAALRTRTAHLDIPIALALFAAGAWGVVNTVRGVGEIYFDSVSVLVFLLLVGRWVQHRQQRAAADSIDLMLTLTPTSATLVGEDGSRRRVPIESVTKGARLAVDSGECVPADGVVVKGSTTLDNALLTGESEPVLVREGDGAHAGANNTGSAIEIEVVATGAQTRVGKLMALVSEASREKSGIVRFADRIAGVFVSVVIVLASVTMLVWSVLEGVTSGVEHATALLIITCPCALGLATPTAMSVALGRAASRGMLVKSAHAIERLAKPGVMVLDKTGTLTEGRMRVAHTWGDEALIAAAAAVESRCVHPLARAIGAVSEARMGELDASSVTQHAGDGVEGVVGGEVIRVGRASFCGGLSGEAHSEIDRVVSMGLSPVVVTGERGGEAVLGVGDSVREDAGASLEALRASGWDLRLCSGDHESVVARVASQLGIGHAQGGVTPEDKAALVKALKDEDPCRPVVMVGDGVNDAAALASADVGIAVHGGAEASMHAADLYLVKDGVRPIVSLLDLSSSTMRTIRGCLVFSVCYNALGATLAMMGLVDALLAAVIMPISSFTVVAMCTRAGRAKRGAKEGGAS